MNTYYTLIYHRFKINNRLNVGIFIWNDKSRLIKFKDKPTDNELLNDIFFSLFKGLNSYHINDIYKEVERASIYNNGLIGLDKPMLINMEMDNNMLEKLYEKFI